MLRYQFKNQTFGNDIVNLEYYNALTGDYGNIYNPTMLVTLECNDIMDIKSGDKLTIVSEFIYYNSETDDSDTIGDTSVVEVYSASKVTNRIYFLDDKYKNLPISTITAEVVDGVVTWFFDFEEIHFYNEYETALTLYITYGNNDYVYINNGLKYESFDTLSWVYDSTVENAEELSYLLFGDIDLTKNSVLDGRIDNIVVSRPQVKWDLSNGQVLPTVKFVKYTVDLNVPLMLTGKTDLYHEGNVAEYFVENEQVKSINAVTEMEKYVYTPVAVTKISGNTETYTDCIKINFNLHFRTHESENWSVDDDDTWNFIKYGEMGGSGDINKYYSYGTNTDTSTSDKWNVSCQSDLLSYLDFTTNDVKYQRNKLKKSFLRLSFYDSINPGSQKLLAYSTVFVDGNKLYSKFISKSNAECYYDSNGDVVKGIKADREVCESALKNITGINTLTKDEIEEYRLSSQISIQNKYMSDNSSEGFYLYLWENGTTIPDDIYMKAEFIHAGYGRNIPMMAPYKDNMSGNTNKFKTNNDIKNDWLNTDTQYGIKKFLRYSYIHFKYKYDENTKRHIYYLDPETYGILPDGNIININLYEARIAFN